MKLRTAQSRRLRLLRSLPKNKYQGIAAGTPLARVDVYFSKKKTIGAAHWRALRLQIRFSPESIQRTVVVMARCILIWAVNANWNSDNRYWNVNANSVENPNEWNAGNQVLSRYSFLSSAFMAEVLLINPFFHPPIILPIVSMPSPKSAY